MEKFPSATEQEEEEREPFSAVERVLGVGPCDENFILEYFERTAAAGGDEKMREREEAHSPEMDMAIGEIGQKMKPFLERYGVEAVRILPKNVHILDESKFTEQEKVKLLEVFHKVNAFYTSDFQQIMFMFGENEVKYETGSKLKFSKILVHEMLHMNSFQSYEKVGKEEEEYASKIITIYAREGHPEESRIPIAPRRMGFAAYGRSENTKYFAELNEAITEELAKRFDSEYFSQIPDLHDEYAKRERFKSRSKNFAADKDISFVETRKEGKEYSTVIHGFSYPEIREKLNRLIDRIYEKHKDDFKSREEVFDVFAKGMLTGRLLPAARLVEKTFGKGSFRSIGRWSGKGMKEI